MSQAHPRTPTIELLRSEPTNEQYRSAGAEVPKAAIIAEVRDWHIHRMSHLELDDLARMYYPTALWRTFQGLNRRLVRWARGKYKRYRISETRATHWLRQLARQRQSLFAHWHLGIVP